ncbi:MAG: hypothetical protein NTV68_00990, partial [Methanomicrobiales archaeon]|nr:hypothetical protein [Methanomicrobiales archaeon]
TLAGTYAALVFLSPVADDSVGGRFTTPIAEFARQRSGKSPVVVDQGGNVGRTAGCSLGVNQFGISVVECR